jgi:hypothetical protein
MSFIGLDRVAIELFIQYRMIHLRFGLLKSVIGKMYITSAPCSDRYEWISAFAGMTEKTKDQRLKIISIYRGRQEGQGKRYSEDRRWASRKTGDQADISMRL